MKTKNRVIEEQPFIVTSSNRHFFFLIFNGQPSFDLPIYLLSWEKVRTYMTSMNGMNNLKISRAAIRKGCNDSNTHQLSGSFVFKWKEVVTDRGYLH